MKHLVWWACLYTLAQASTAELLISQVVEGSSYNKAVTLSNHGNTTLNLQDYSLSIAYNGKDWTPAVSPVGTGVLQPEDTFTLCHPKISKLGVPFCDGLDTQINFNGNDAIGLEREGVLIDVFGEVSTKNAYLKGFSVTGLDGASLDHTSVRISSVTVGTTDWTSSSDRQWAIFPKNSFVPGDGVIVNLAGTIQAQEEEAEKEVPQESESDKTEGPTDKQDQTSEFPANGKLVVGTFNVEFLFDGIKDPPFAAFSKSPEMAQKHLEDISAVIRKINPDIMTLCEVENKDMLDRLAARVGNDTSGYFVQGTDAFTGQDVALLSKFPPQKISRRNERSQYPLEGSMCGSTRKSDTSVSKNFQATYDEAKIFPFKFAILAAHLKAFPTDASSCAKREGQALVLQQAAAQLIDEGYELMIMGDLNDYSDKSSDVDAHVPTSRVLSMLRDPNKDGKDELKNVMELVPMEKRYTALYDKNRNGKIDGISELSQIDHILLTSGLWDRVIRAWIDQNHDPFKVSDHWPVMIELRIYTDEPDAGNDT